MNYGNIIGTVQILIGRTGETLTFSSDQYDISGDIQRSSVANLNSGNITVDNIFPATFSRLWKARIGANSGQIILRVEIGREGLGFFKVCEKDIIESSMTKSEQTYKAKFLAVAGMNALSQNYTINTKNANLQQIMEDFSSVTTIPIGKIQTTDIKNVDFVTLPQTGTQTLKQIERAFPNANVYVDGNKIYAIDKNSWINKNKGLKIGTNQLRLPPTLEANRIKCDIHLDPRFEINDIVEIDSKVSPYLNGQYKVVNVIHNFSITRTGNSTGSTKIELLYFPF